MLLRAFSVGLYFGRFFLLSSSRLKNYFRLCQPKIDISKEYKRGPFGSAGGRIPEGGAFAPPPKSATAST